MLRTFVTLFFCSDRFFVLAERPHLVVLLWQFGRLPRLIAGYMDQLIVKLISFNAIQTSYYVTLFDFTNVTSNSVFLFWFLLIYFPVKEANWLKYIKFFQCHSSISPRPTKTCKPQNNPPRVTCLNNTNIPYWTCHSNTDMIDFSYQYNIGKCISQTRFTHLKHHRTEVPEVSASRSCIS